MESKKDTTCRKWMITINNPLDKGFSHDKIKEVLISIRGLDYWAMCDEIGNEKTYFTYAYSYTSYFPFSV